MRGDDKFEKVKKSCLDYKSNQKLHSLGSSAIDTRPADSKNETAIEDSCEHMKQMQLMMAKLEKKTVPSKPSRDR